MHYLASVGGYYVGCPVLAVDTLKLEYPVDKLKLEYPPSCPFVLGDVRNTTGVPQSVIFATAAVYCIFPCEARGGCNLIAPKVTLNDKVQTRPPP